MKSIFKHLLPIAACVAWANASADVHFQYSADAQLIGATGIVVSGHTYNVSFEDGTCTALYSGCNDLADFLFSDPISAAAAADAITIQVFNSPLFDPGYDLFPYFTSGCHNISVCYVLTPYAPGLAFASANSDDIGDSIVLPPVSISPFTNTEFVPDQVWAIWTRPSPAPEPASVLLLGAGLLAYGASHHHRPSKTVCTY